VEEGAGGSVQAAPLAAAAASAADDSDTAGVSGPAPHSVASSTSAASTWCLSPAARVSMSGERGDQAPHPFRLCSRATAT